MKILSQIQKIVGAIVLISLTAFLISFLGTDFLPKPAAALPGLKNAPVQGPTTEARFSVKSGDVEYEIAPMHSYDLYGMIVSAGDNLGLFSRFKDSDPLNSNDLCVIWGNNITSGVYKDMDFKNQEFMCFMTYHGTKSDFQNFSNIELSNNHLLADSEKNPGLYNKIRNAHPGDQIHFKGYLVSYTVKKDGTVMGSRVSSTNREDTGNGACESVFVTDFEILKKNYAPFFMIHSWSEYVLIYGLSVWVALLIISLLLPSKKVDSAEIIEETAAAFDQSLPTNITKTPPSKKQQ